ncbi:hypothetical protein E4U57_003126 [Claviceps arundinis]|uniref:Uncharacterized protein n=1 Tax=Claviceps arundinis TaxID=1623583 RepID=A0A9P7MMQ8_9HYPO|nr:hypothetical protein E4U57_003126 [Claviceps arundinis]KAG5961921.1 hypothetical protein E4U56_003627 [Claviceps arundinis]
MFSYQTQTTGGMRKDDEHPIWTAEDYHNELLGRDCGSRRRIQLWKHAMTVRGNAVQSRRFTFHCATRNGGIVGSDPADLSRQCLQVLGAEVDPKMMEIMRNVAGWREYAR